MNTLTLLRPDDWHIHLRDGAALKTTVAHAAARFARAIVMPNLSPPVVTTEQALAYRARIVEHVPARARFEPLMTLYLTDNTPADEIRRAKAAGVAAVKLYPAGATTNSESGVTAIEKVIPALEAMQAHDLPLLVHGEVTDAGIDIFDREAVFIERVLEPLTRRFPGLRVVFEHITTRAAVDFVTAAPATIAATITAHHLLYNRNALLAGGVRPHYYCLPVLKREADRQALLRAAIDGNPKFFLGTDSAPHARDRKETACGCAGIYSAHAGIELYAEAFEQAGALDRLEGFASRFGADFYRLPRNTDRITLVRQSWDAPESYPLADGTLVPLRAGSKLEWRLRP
ncbi:MAG: dihydroorotase [Gammaproteobacteria bacterium]